MRVTRIWAIGLLLTAGCRQILGFEAAVSTEDAATGEPDGPVIVEDTLVPDMTAEGWALRKPITIDGAQVEGGLTGFPVLVRIASDPDLAASARGDGFDLLFMADDGTTKLAHEIERFDGNSGELVAWVRLPTLSANTDTQLFLYFGNPAAPDQQDKPAVWDSAYLGVWHLGETAGTAIADSTSHARTGTKSAADAPTPTAGIIGGGQQFAGNVDGIAIGNAAELDIQNLTFETWVVLPECQGDVYRRVIDFTLDFEFSYALAYPCTGAPNINPKSLLIDTTPNGANRQTPANSLTSDVPHHLVFQSNQSRLFLDGVDLDLTFTAVALAQDNVLTMIGNRQNPIDRGVIGVMDEVRISNVRRSPAYVQTSFNNQRPGSTFLTIGPTEAAPPLPD